MSTMMCVFAIQAVQHIAKTFFIIFYAMILYVATLALFPHSLGMRLVMTSLVPRPVRKIAFQMGLGTRLSYDLHLLHVTCRYQSLRAR